ncbi:MAG: DUF1003 domain-containing protein [Eubacteriaceae bacterium]
MNDNDERLEERNAYLKELLKETEDDFDNEELLHTLMEQRVSRNINEKEEMNFGQRAADKVAQFAGSWGFIFSFCAMMVVWMIINIMMADQAFDAYPFILLNLVLSCIAAIQAPLIMMSQNRQEEKDRKRAENDFIVNLKSELMVDNLHEKLDQVLENQELILQTIEAGESEEEELIESQEQKPAGSQEPEQEVSM